MIEFIVEMISYINMEIVFEILKNFFDIVLPIVYLVVGIIGLFFMFKIIYLSLKVEKIDNDIRQAQDDLHKIELDQIKNQNSYYYINSTDGLEECIKREAEQKIEKLELERRLLLDQISIYKIFKNN